MSKTIRRSIPDVITNEYLDQDESLTVAQRVMARLGVLPEIDEERKRQDTRWGEQNHPDGTGPGYRIQAIEAHRRCDRAARLGLVTYRDILEEEVYEAFAETDAEELRAELVQVAAVAVAWIEKLDRERNASSKFGSWVSSENDGLGCTQGLETR